MFFISRLTAVTVAICLGASAYAASTEMTNNWPVETPYYGFVEAVADTAEFLNISSSKETSYTNTEYVVDFSFVPPENLGFYTLNSTFKSILSSANVINYYPYGSTYHLTLVMSARQYDKFKAVTTGSISPAPLDFNTVRIACDNALDLWPRYKIPGCFFADLSTIGYQTITNVELISTYNKFRYSGTRIEPFYAKKYVFSFPTNDTVVIDTRATIIDSMKFSETGSAYAGVECALYPLFVTAGKPFRSVKTQLPDTNYSEENSFCELVLCLCVARKNETTELCLGFYVLGNHTSSEKELEITFTKYYSNSGVTLNDSSIMLPRAYIGSRDVNDANLVIAFEEADIQPTMVSPTYLPDCVANSRPFTYDRPGYYDMSSSDPAKVDHGSFYYRDRTSIYYTNFKDDSGRATVYKSAGSHSDMQAFFEALLLTFSPITDDFVVYNGKLCHIGSRMPGHEDCTITNIEYTLANTGIRHAYSVDKTAFRKYNQNERTLFSAFSPGKAVYTNNIVYSHVGGATVDVVASNVNSATAVPTSVIYSNAQYSVGDRFVLAPFDTTRPGTVQSISAPTSSTPDTWDASGTFEVTGVFDSYPVTNIENFVLYEIYPATSTAKIVPNPQAPSETHFYSKEYTASSSRQVDKLVSGGTVTIDGTVYNIDTLNQKEDRPTSYTTAPGTATVYTNGVGSIALDTESLWGVPLYVCISNIAANIIAGWTPPPSANREINLRTAAGNDVGSGGTLYLGYYNHVGNNDVYLLSKYDTLGNYRTLESYGFDVLCNQTRTNYTARVKFTDKLYLTAKRSVVEAHLVHPPHSTASVLTKLYVTNGTHSLSTPVFVEYNNSVYYVGDPFTESPFSTDPQHIGTVTRINQIDSSTPKRWDITANMSVVARDTKIVFGENAALGFNNFIRNDTELGMFPTVFLMSENLGNLTICETTNSVVDAATTKVVRDKERAASVNNVDSLLDGAIRSLATEGFVIDGKTYKLKKEE